ncbi:MAG: 8-amino-7-oxononanoate synthase [Bdellovibrionales bacterium]
MPGSELTRELDSLRARGLYRELVISDPAVLDFSSNDYLGLSRHPAIRAALVEALENGIAVGATGSRLLSGHSPIHERVEQALAKVFGAEGALLFSSGYIANLAVLSALGGRTSEFFSDALNHASLIDGVHLARARRTRFRHNDVQDLRDKLKQSTSSRKIVVTESVFSMDGDLAPLADLIACAQEFSAWLVVDEAHATGVFGAQGHGCMEDLKDLIDGEDERIVLIHTCGKAMGAQGAFVLTSASMREFLINMARPFVFSTGLSPLLAVQIETAAALLPALTAERQYLMDLSSHLRESLRETFAIGESHSQIVPLVLGSNEAVLSASARLRAQGLDVRAIRSPTVPPGTERLRISLKSFHTRADIVRLIQGLRTEVCGI